MSTVLVKIFATALTLSQVTVAPEALRTQFDPQADQAAVTQILKDGCTQMRRAFDIEDINLDDLIVTAMEDPTALTSDVKILQGLSFTDLHTAYRQFCKSEPVPGPTIDLTEVIKYYNAALADLPDHGKLKGLQLPGMSTVLDGKGARFAEVHEPDHRRVWVPLASIPREVQQAFVAAEDKRFQQHRGVDERGVIRAFMGNLAESGRPQGGSTITQQVAKNLLVGDDVTYERKMREMVVASRIERTLTKDEILEIYLNSIYLGRMSWGIEMAARSYFGKPASALTMQEGALLAGLAKGPNYYNPERQPERARERYAYVLNRLQEDGAIAPEAMKQAVAALPRLAAFDRPLRTSGFYFVDHVGRDARTLAGIEGITSRSYTVKTTLNAPLQRATEAALQEGLARYELSVGRHRFAGPEANLAEAVRAIETAAKPASGAPADPPWRQALAAARLKAYDVHWPAAVVLPGTRDKKGAAEAQRVGLADGRVLPLTAWNAAARRGLKAYDVVRVRVQEGDGKQRAARAELRGEPEVQGAALVLENKTGRILSMAGGFSYPDSQLNRVTQAHRQPGSALKPLTFLAALGRGLQPNTLIWDSPVTLPPVGGGANARARDYWSPKNYDGGASGPVTLRRALENSKNLVTARLLDGGINSDPEQSLKRVCELGLEAQLYVECTPHYPFVLGAQPVRILDLAAFYAAIANEGALPTPHAVEAIEDGGKTIYARKASPLVQLGSADRAAFFQMKTILQGVLERGTGRPIRRLAPYVAGKTGTTDNENDAWFVGFTNDVTVAVWVGYDNADGKRRTLGRGQTGGKIAIPIFEPIVEAAWQHHAPRTALAPPSREAARQLMALPIDVNSGDRLTEGQGRGFTEYFRLSRTGQLDETQYRLVTRDEVYAFRNPDPYADGEAGGWTGDGYAYDPYALVPGFREVPRQDGRYQQQQPYAERPWWEEERPRRRPRRVDPDYLWGRGPIY
ncbi:MAG TPA: transglycosylase domain-containing protein [Microvirga sp.]|jgi:membrane carboxypeptidase/penicillin-binding protein|nr:transglycosylase domain-containing protein [Microvirga sp.]